MKISSGSNEARPHTIMCNGSLSWIERGKTDASRKSHLLHHIKEWTVGLEAAIS